MAAASSHDHSTQYKENSLTLWGAVSMGTGVMIGAGIFALTGQVAELARGWFPLAMLLSVFFDLSRIASLGAIVYILMDIAIHWRALVLEIEKG